MTIGLFDSGLGGLTVYKAVRAAFPQESIIYLGDTARLPYGTKDPSTIIRYAVECLEFLLQHHVDLVICACNTTSALALAQLQERSPVPVLGTIDCAVDAAFALGKDHIGVIGTPATIRSGAYEKEIKRRDANIKVLSTACPLFVPLVEEGFLLGEIPKEVVKHYLSPMRESEVEAVILGCTHYPLLAPVLQEFFGEQVQFVDCASALARQAQKMVNVKEDNGDRGKSRFFVTDGLSQFHRIAGEFLDEAYKKEIMVEVVALKDISL